MTDSVNQTDMKKKTMEEDTENSNNEYAENLVKNRENYKTRIITPTPPRTPNTKMVNPSR